jgi:hypothetical protein
MADAQEQEERRTIKEQRDAMHRQKSAEEFWYPKPGGGPKGWSERWLLFHFEDVEK